jgi:hypothetical protein
MTITTDRIQFDEAAHSYSLDGAPLESVNKVIGSVLRIDSRFWKEEHRLRGKYVHAITEAIDEGNWSPEDTVIPDDQDKEGIFQRCYAYQDFLELTGFQSLLVEAKVASPTLGIAGTLDRYGKITKGRYAGRYAILDIKSGLPTAGAILQLALYEICVKNNIGRELRYPEHQVPDLRIILHLRPDGKCRPEYREGPQDIFDALALVRVWQFMKRENLLGKEEK